MKNEKVTVKIEAQLSDDKKHRYSYMKKWDAKRPMVTVITIYPGSDDVLKEDLTTMLITNQLIADYGGFYLVNLFSKIGLTKMSLGNATELNDLVSDEVIVACAEASSEVILAWGSVTQLKVGAKRADEIGKLVAGTGNVQMLTDGEGKICYHPLSPKVRMKWHLETIIRNE